MLPTNLGQAIGRKINIAQKLRANIDSRIISIIIFYRGSNVRYHRRGWSAAEFPSVCMLWLDPFSLKKYLLDNSLHGGRQYS